MKFLVKKFFILVFILFPLSSGFPQSSAIKKVLVSDYVFQPYSDEGYFQGWNYYFLNSEFQIFVTSLISNLGPGSLNHGVAISVQSGKTGSYFSTKEFSNKSLEANKKKYFVKSYNNSFEEINGDFEIKVFTDNVKLYLKFSSPRSGVTLSGGKIILDQKKFLKADIPFHSAKVEGYIDFKGTVYDLKGTGGMEHLITNQEVYKFSSRWEIMRSFSANGMKLFLGGYYGKKEEGDFRTFVILDASGAILDSGKVLESKVEKFERDSLSGYKIPIVEVHSLGSEDCQFRIQKASVAGRINILESISVVLRFFVKLFFANPYILIHNTSNSLNCKHISPTPIDFQGVQSHYLINSK